MLRKLLTSKKRYPDVPHQVSLRELMQKEAKIGANLFGELSQGRRREFFMLDEHTWIWYEEWRDAMGAHRITTRYEIHPDYILKKQNDGNPETVSGRELDHIFEAITSYYFAVSQQVYHRPAQL